MKSLFLYALSDFWYHKLWPAAIESSSSSSSQTHKHSYYTLPHLAHRIWWQWPKKIPTSCAQLREVHVHTIELGDVLQILWSEAVVERVPGRTLVVWPHHWVARRGVNKAERVAELMQQYGEQIGAFRSCEETEKGGEAEWTWRCRGVKGCCSRWTV